MKPKLDDIKKKIAEVEALKREAIQELLSQRTAIDAQLHELEYKPGGKRGRPPGSKNKPKPKPKTSSR